MGTSGGAAAVAEQAGAETGDECGNGLAARRLVDLGGETGEGARGFSSSASRPGERRMEIWGAAMRCGFVAAPVTTEGRAETAGE